MALFPAVNNCAARSLLWSLDTMQNMQFDAYKTGKQNLLPQHGSEAVLFLIP